MRTLVSVQLTCVVAASLPGCGDDSAGGNTDAAPFPDAAIDSGPATCGTLPIVPIPLTPDVPVDGTTAGGTSLTSVHGILSFCQLGDGAGPEAVYSYTLDRPADLLVTVTSQNPAGMVFYVRTDCALLNTGGVPIPDQYCNDVETPDVGRTIQIGDAALTTYYLFVDSASATTAGPFQIDLHVRDIHQAGQSCIPNNTSNSRCVAGTYCDPTTLTCAHEHDCSDFQDEDGDGLVDCDDPDCRTQAVCTPGATPIGGRCQRNSDCAATNGAPVCYDEISHGFPGGYCMQWCDPTVQDCPAGATCIANNGGSRGQCFQTCTAASDCASGYECVETAARSTGTLSARVCAPNCTSDAQCTATGNCAPFFSAMPPPILDLGMCRNAAIETSCANGLDDDGDNHFDCEDYDCESACAATFGSACAGARTAVSGTNSGGTATLPHDFAGSCAGWQQGGEEIWTFTPPGTGDGALHLLASSGSLYVRSSCAERTTELGCSGFSHLVLPATGAVPLAIFADDHSGAYTLDVGYEPSTEVEPNNSIATATAYASGFVGTLPPGDVDFVAITLGAGQSSIAVETSDFGDGACAWPGLAIDTALTLYGSDGATVLASNDDISNANDNSANYCSRLDLTGLAPGTYYVKVTASPFARLDYRTAYRLVVTTS